MAHHVSDLVDGLDLTACDGPYEGDGRRTTPDAPRMRVKGLVDAYATGVLSSRGIARKLEEAVAVRVLGAGNFPPPRTLGACRRRPVSDVRKLLVEVVRLARDQDRTPTGGPPYTRAYGEPDEKAQRNFTDPESGIMKPSSEGFQQCYTARWRWRVSARWWWRRL